MRTLQDWLQYQQQVHPTSIDMGLERVRQVAQRLQLLPVTARSAIVGGTNGKGSTATHLSCLLQASGLRTGLFTSPHLRRYNERICIDARPVNDAELTAAFEQIEAARCDISLTFFEFNALAALLLFRAHQVQAMVLEVGLGGRLDATNLVDADVAVVCSIGLDHTDWLGATVELIGGEKAGIFRPAAPVVLGSADMPASIYEAARLLECPLRVAERDFSWSCEPDGSWQFRGQRDWLAPLPPPQLRGDTQYRNAATAIAALAELLHRAARPPPALDPVRRGLAAVRLEGRLQRVQRQAEWLLDVAHNPAAAAVLAYELTVLPPAPRTIAVFGMLADKDVAGVVRALDPLIDHWCLCDLDDPRGLSAAQLRARMGAVRGSIEPRASVADACACAAGLAHPGDRVVACGSFHVVGPALDFLRL